MVIALAAAAVRITVGQLVIDPLTSLLWPPAKAPAGTESIVGNLPTALVALLIVWTLAAFGEEIGYRGYLITRAADPSLTITTSDDAAKNGSQAEIANASEES